MRQLLTSVVTIVGVSIAAVPSAAQQAAADSIDPIREIVGRLDLEHYKATIKGLTQSKIFLRMQKLL
jgi:hypothetical protein